MPESGWRRRVSEKRRKSVAELASQQRARRRLEVKHAAVDAAAAQLLDVLRERGQRGGAGVDAHRGALLARVGEEVDRLEEEIGGQVVDAVIARVLEHVQRDAFSGAGKTADQDELH